MDAWCHAPAPPSNPRREAPGGVRAGYGRGTRGGFGAADYRGSFRTTEGQRIEALEVYCEGCCRPYDE
ncbi:hypothetical protein AB0F34_15680, partial [Streptomyces fradiae]